MNRSGFEQTKIQSECGNIYRNHSNNQAIIYSTNIVECKCVWYVYSFLITVLRLSRGYLQNRSSKLLKTTIVLEFLVVQIHI